jgi:ribonucleoside-triphosphate reductase
LKAVSLIDDYIAKSDWRVNENANMEFSYPGLVGYVSSHSTAEYMLRNIVPHEASQAHRDAFIHIHDLSGMCNYCLGLGLEEFLWMGIDDIDGPPRHFSSAMNQLANLIFLISQQIAGAVAFNTVDVLMAPYIKKDELTYKQIKQVLQEFVYTINVKGRIGYQTPFVNFQLDVTVPNRLNGNNPIIAGEMMDFTYNDLTWEIESFNRALLEVLMESKRVLAFPVINIGITKDFNWDNKLAETIFSAVGKIGQPTFNNYVHGCYDPDSVRSMCCSLRLDMSQIIKQTGGQFGAADNSGSIGVVTLNLPLYGYLSGGDKDILYFYIDKYMSIAFDALIEKRKFIERMMEIGMYPTLHRFVQDFRHFFNTIGIIGLNEMLLNMGRKGIEDKESIEFCLEVLDKINQNMVQFQLEHKDFYGEGHGLLANLELVPGEGCTTRFAKHIKTKYKDFITANGTEHTYLTRGCWLPADKKYALSDAAKHQEILQDKFSGGANFNWYIEEQINDWRSVRSIVKKLINNTSLPFISISPTIYTCPVCGKKESKTEWCEHDLSQEKINELKSRGVEVDGKI